MTQTMHKLVISKDGETLRTLDLSQHMEIIVGRSSDCQVVLTDRAISRRHARLELDGDTWYIEDLGSMNGTERNGVPVSERVLLEQGDSIGVGPFVLDFGQKPIASRARFDESVGHLTIHAISLEDFTDSRTPTRTGAHPAGTPQPIAPPSGSSSRVSRFMRNVDTIGKAFLSHRPMQELYDKIVEVSDDLLTPDRVALLIRDKEGGELNLKAVRRKRGNPNDEIVISRSIAQQAIEEKQAILSTDAMSDDRFQGKESIANLQIQSAMCAPLWNDSEVVGILYADNRRAPTLFSEDDLHLLTLIGHWAAVKIAETEALEEVHLQKQREEELKHAARLQQNLLPEDVLTSGPYRFGGHNIPSLDVGGDYFDYFCGDAGKTWAALGDVSGKGMPAALVMSNLHASFHAQIEAGLDLELLAPRLNRSVNRAAKGERFITFFVLSIEGKTNRLRYVNAGHNPPMLLRTSGEIELLEKGGLFLGVFMDAEYEVGETMLEPRESLLLYSDGITEGRNHDDEEFGEERLADFYRAHHCLPPTEFAEKLIDEVQSFCADGDPGDDVTVLLIQRCP